MGHRWENFFHDCCEELLTGCLFNPPCAAHDLIILGEYMDEQESQGCDDYSAMAEMLLPECVALDDE
jgi:hypothetical protein